MVAFASSTLFLALCSAALALSLPTRDVSQIESDLATISTQLTALDTAINAFPATGGNLIQALTIHDNAQTLSTTISTSTSDITSNGALSETDAQTILATVTGFEPTMLQTLTDIQGKKAAFEGLGVAGITTLVESDLTTLANNTQSFEAAIEAAVPTDLQANAMAVATAINAGFAAAIATYASA